jgi:uncharacterized membrane protein
VLRIPRFAVTGLVVLTVLAGVAPASAQSTPAPAEAPRPTILKMDPGNSLGTQKAKPPETTKAKSRVIPVVGGSSSTAPATKSRKPPENDYEFCNQTSFVLSLSVGLKSGPMVHTRGWWPLNAGECRVFIKGPLSSNVYYSHAKTHFAHTGPIRVWGGKHKLCAGKGNFQSMSAEGQDTCGPGYTQHDYARVETGGKPGWQTVFTESSQIKSLEQARVAGLQRLLTDVKLFDGAIDGVPGPKFNEAMTQARTAFGVGAGDQANLYAKLLTEAGRLQQSAGLTFCNRTQEMLWTAYAREVNGKKISRGWYVLMPEQCEKVIKEPLSEPFIYTYAVIDAPEGPQVSGPNWSGTHIFCTKDGEFDFDDSSNCGGKGFTPSGFFRVDTDGKAVASHDFLPNAPAAPPTE